MRRLFTILIFWLASFAVLGQNKGFNYQALIVDNDGKPIVSKSVKLKFGIIPTAITGTAIYEEEHTVTTSETGEINVVVGSSTTVLTGTSLAAINWKTYPMFLSTSVDIGGGYKSLGATQLQAVPYALYAENGVNVPSGPNNVAVGADALKDNVTGSRNVAVGVGALQANTSSVNNAVGYLALNKNTTASENNAFGHQALEQNTTGTGNAGFGHNVMQANQTGNFNTAMGYAALKSTTTSYNSAFGSGALANNSTGIQGVAVGSNSLNANTTGSSNTGLGTSSLMNNTTGSYNTALGNSSLMNNIVGVANTAVGFNTLTRATNSRNTAVGNNSLSTTTSGENNTAVGFNSLLYNTTGSFNVAIGDGSQLNNTLGSYNSTIGYLSSYSNTTGTNNVALGREALHLNTTGNNLAAIGANAGKANTTGSNNTYLGASANTSTGTISNSTAIGYDAQVTASNQIQLGNSSVKEVKTSGKITAAGGFLPPKMTAAQRDAIVDPDQGLMIYCTNCGSFGETEFFNGNEWKAFSGANTAAVITDVLDGLVANFALDGSPSGTTSSTGTLISTNTYNMTSGWSATLAATNPNKTYKIVVSGTWGIANGRAHRDAAYDAGSNNTIGLGGTPVLNAGCDANWNFDGACFPPTPSFPVGYANNNTYEYIVTGKSGGYAIAFSDGGYGDNTGALTFKLYELGIPGTVNGTVTYTTNRKGVANSAMQAGSGYITAPSNIFQFTRTQSFTVSVWFTADNVTTSGRLLSTENSEGNFRIAKYNTGRMAVQFGDYQETDVTTGVWHHLVYTYNNRTEKVYIDNVLVNTNTDTSTEAVNYGAPFTIGAKAASAFDKWAGKIDDVRVYNRALVPSEVSVLFNQ